MPVTTGEEAAEIVPTERRTGFVLRAHGQLQSYVDLDDPTYLAFDYVRRLAVLLDGWGEPGAPMRVVHVGGAAMTLPRYLAATRPRSSQVVLEPDAALTELVRAELPLPRRSGIKVRPVDGRSGLEALREGGFDVIVVDAYADGRVPAELVTRECFEAMERALDQPGLVLLNLTDRAPFAWTRRVVAAAGPVLGSLVVGAEPETLRGRRTGNLLLAASPDRALVADLAGRLRASSAPYRVLDAGKVSDTFGGGRPFVDADSEGSPAPV